jgi:hypothetical protein
MAMRRLSKSVRFALGALLAAALALSPVAAFAGVGAAMDHGGATVSDESAPCDMPCDDCGDGKPSLACAVACSGLVASVLADAPALPSAVPLTRTAAVLKIVSDGRQREPDKPPPRAIPA